jgi:hypothetical protein
MDRVPDPSSRSATVIITLQLHLYAMLGLSDPSNYHPLAPYIEFREMLTRR